VSVLVLGVVVLSLVLLLAAGCGPWVERPATGPQDRL
jgi:hypothetical protein